MTNNLARLTFTGSSGLATFANDVLVSGSLTTSLNNTTTGMSTLTGRAGIGKAQIYLTLRVMWVLGRLTREHIN